jgi:hypothetical protein
LFLNYQLPRPKKFLEYHTLATTKLCNYIIKIISNKTINRIKTEYNQTIANACDSLPNTKTFSNSETDIDYEIIKLQKQRELERERERERDLVVEGNTGVRANALLSGAESPEILGGFGDHVLVELHHHPPF